MSRERIEMTWQVQDGYAGGRRPQTVRIDVGNFEPSATDEEIRDGIMQDIENEFAEKVHAAWDEKDMNECVAAVRRALAGEQ
jgi:hypothetical protein